MNVRSAVVLFASLALLPASALADDTTGAAPPAPAPSGPVHVSTALASVARTTAQANAGAGAAKGEQGPRAEADAPTAPTTKPLAGPRMLRRMDAQRVLQSLQDAFAACYTRSDSHSAGGVVIRANTSATGQVESTEVASQEGLPLGVVQCISDRVREVRFRAPGGSGLAVLVPVRFGPRS
jgi:hypothetical protein